MDVSFVHYKDHTDIQTAHKQKHALEINYLNVTIIIVCCDSRRSMQNIYLFIYVYLNHDGII